MSSEDVLIDLDRSPRCGPDPFEAAGRRRRHDRWPMRAASGLRDREALEQRLRQAALDVAGVSEARVALNRRQAASHPGRHRVGQGRRGQIHIDGQSRHRPCQMGKKVGLIDADIYGPSQTDLVRHA
jgi:hypothetical protein